MNEHLSDLVLDTLAARGDEACEAGRRAHLGSCSACAKRLAAFRVERARALTAAEYLRLAGDLDRLRPTRRPWRRVVPAVALALAACLAVIVFVRVRGSDEQVRLKGGAGLEVLAEENGHGPPFRPGERVALQVSPAGHGFAIVLGVDDGGKVVKVWPVRGNASGEVKRGAITRLDPSFRVTPGNLTLFALFSDEPIASDVVGALQAAAERARANNEPLEGLQPPPIPGEAAHARARMLVEDGR